MHRGTHDDLSGNTRSLVLRIMWTVIVIATAPTCATTGDTPIGTVAPRREGTNNGWEWTDWEKRPAGYYPDELLADYVDRVLPLLSDRAKDGTAGGSLSTASPAPGVHSPAEALLEAEKAVMTSSFGDADHELYQQQPEILESMIDEPVLVHNTIPGSAGLTGDYYYVVTATHPDYGCAGVVTMNQDTTESDPKYRHNLGIAAGFPPEGNRTYTIDREEAKAYFEATTGRRTTRGPIAVRIPPPEDEWRHGPLPEEFSWYVETGRGGAGNEYIIDATITSYDAGRSIMDQLNSPESRSPRAATPARISRPVPALNLYERYAQATSDGTAVRPLWPRNYEPVF